MGRERSGSIEAAQVVMVASCLPKLLACDGSPKVEEATTLEAAPELMTATSPKMAAGTGLGDTLSKVAQKKDSMHEVVPSKRLHQGVKQQLVEEEKFYSLMSYNFRKGATGPYSHVDYYLRHMNRHVMISTTNGPMDMQDSTFKVLHALCKPGEGSCPAQNAGSTGCISLESVNFPGFFLTTAKGSEVHLARADGTSGFKAKASFCIQAGLADPAAVSLEIMGTKGKFIRHSGYGVFACSEADTGNCIKSSRTTDFNADSTFFLKPG